MAPAIAMAPMPALENNRPAAPDGASQARDDFAQMQAIRTIGPTTDPGDFADQLLTATMNGDAPAALPHGKPAGTRFSARQTHILRNQ